MSDIVSVDQLSSTEYKVSINVPSSGVDKRFDDFFKSIKKDVEVPGFRKGHVPIPKLKQMFSKKARPTIVQMIINEYYIKALKDNDIVPIGNPRPEGIKPGDEYPGKFGFDNSYSVDLIVEVLPSLDPEGYIGMELDFPEYDSDSMFDKRMMSYQKQFAEKNQVTDRGAEIGDSVVIDFTGFLDGEKFDGGAATGHSINSLGNSGFIPGFEEQIVGMKPGETKEIDVKFPEGYRAEHLAGKDSKFEIILHSIVETKLAEVDDDLAMMVGHESVEELNDRVRSEVKTEQDNLTKMSLDRQIVDKLLEINKFDAPMSMVLGEEQRILSASGNKIENLPEQARAEVRRMAEFNVKRALIMESIYEKEDEVEITPEALNKLLEQHASASNQSKDDLVSNLYNSGQMDTFVGVLKVANVFDFIVDRAQRESEESDDSR